MGQQTSDSKFSEYGLASIETGLQNHDKHMSAPTTAKKTALRDIQNGNAVAVPTSVGSPLLRKESECTGETVKFSGTKRSKPESLMNSPHQSLTSNAVNGHLVYVRRKFETDLGKNGSPENKSNKVEYPHLVEIGGQDGEPQEKIQIKNFKNCIPDTESIPRTLSECSSVSASLEKSNNIVVSTGSDHLRVTSASSLVDYPKKTDIYQWEERYSRMQNLLKKLDQSNQSDYVQMLLSLSSVDLSRHAVELEKRSIQLSLEEAKEMQRVRLLDVLRKYPKNF